MNRSLLVGGLVTALVSAGCDPYLRTNPLDPAYEMTVTLVGPDSVFSINDTIQFQILTDPVHPNLPFVWTTTNNQRLAIVADKAGSFTSLTNGIVRVRAEYGPRIAEKEIVILQKAVDLSIAPPASTSFVSLGEDKILTASVVDARGVPVAGATGTLVWTSSNPDALSVENNGRVRALQNGSAWIKAESGGRADSIHLTAQQVPANVRFDRAIYEILIPGGSIQANVRVDDARGNAIVSPTGLTLTSSNSGFQVTPTGLVTASGWGSTQITARIDQLEANATVRVRGGTSPLVTRGVAGLLRTDRGVASDFLIVELDARDAELDLDYGIVEVYSNAGVWMTTQVMPLIQGLADQEASLLLAKLPGALSIRTTLHDAALNKSQLHVTNAVPQPATGSPDVQISSLTAVGASVEANVDLMKGDGNLRKLYLIGFTADGQIAASRSADLASDPTQATITLQLPTGAQVAYVGVAVSDSGGLFSIVRTQDMPGAALVANAPASAILSTSRGGR